MRHALLLSLALVIFSSPLLANPPGSATPIVFYKNRGVSISFCVGAMVVAASLGLVGGNYWRGQQTPEFLNGALRPLVSAEGSLEDLNTPHRTIVLSAERYYVEAAGITHASGAVLPGSKDTVAIAALQNLIIRQDGAGYLHAFNPFTQKWILIFDKKVTQFKTSMRNLAVIDEDGTLHCYWVPFEGKFRFEREEHELTTEEIKLKAFPQGKFDNLISVDGVSLLATDVSDPDHRRILILNEQGLGILKNEEKRDAGLQEFLRKLEEQQRRAQGEAPQA